jgi:hypothetical protein
MGVKRYKKTVGVEALEFTESLDSIKEVLAWMAEGGITAAMRLVDGVLKLLIPTLEGPMFASPGDYIAKGHKGEFWAIKPDIFAETYEEVE